MNNEHITPGILYGNLANLLNYHTDWLKAQGLDSLELSGATS